MKNAAKIMLAALFVAAGVRAEDKPAPKPPKRHQGEGRIYEKKITASFVPAKDWEQGKNVTGSYLIFRGPANERSPNVNVSTFSHQGVPITQVGPAMKNVHAKGIADWKVIDEGFVTIDGKKSYFFSGKYTRDLGDRKEEMQTISYYVPGISRGYVISFLTNAEKFEGLKPTIEEMAKSFRGD
jgi:hypothetical protein